MRASLGLPFLFLVLACGDDGGATPTDESSGSSSGAPTTGSVETTLTTTATTESSSDETSSGSAASTSGADESSSSSTGAPDEIDPRIVECLRIDACEADGGTPIGVQACLAHALDLPWLWASTGVQRLSIEALECKLAASDCETVRACTPALDDFGTLCGENPGGDACDGDTWVLCDPLGEPVAALDCAAAGLSCNKDIWAGCGAESCTFGATEPSCEGDTLVQCDPSGHVQRIDCATQYNYVSVHGQKGDETFAIAGTTCGMDEMMSALGCIGEGEPCGFFEQNCDGDVLTTCAGGSLAERDCAALDPEGQSCGYWQSGPFAGAATCGYVEPACALDADETCEAGVIGFCAWDEAATIDCVAQGYGGCATSEAGGRTIAHCTP